MVLLLNLMLNYKDYIYCWVPLAVAQTMLLWSKVYCAGWMSANTFENGSVKEATSNNTTLRAVIFRSPR